MSKFIPAVIICGNKNELTDDLGVDFEILGEFKIIDKFGVVVTRNFFREFVSNVGYAPFANVRLLPDYFAQNPAKSNLNEV